MGCGDSSRNTCPCGTKQHLVLCYPRRVTSAVCDYTVELSGFAPYVVASVPAGPIEVSGRLGYYFYDVETRADFDDVTADVFTSNSSGEDLVYGIGLGLTMFETLNARLEYEIIDLERANDANAFWLSGSWRF